MQQKATARFVHDLGLVDGRQWCAICMNATPQQLQDSGAVSQLHQRQFREIV